MNKSDKKLIQAFENLTENKKLYDGIAKLQNDIAMYSDGKNKMIAITAPNNHLHSVLLAKSLATFFQNQDEKVLLLNMNMDENLTEYDDLLDAKVVDLKNVSFEENGLTIHTLEKSNKSAEVLFSPLFKEYIEKANKTFDRIVIVVPPVNSHCDILAIKEYIDSSTVVAVKDETLLVDILKANDFIKENNIPFKGITLLK